MVCERTWEDLAPPKKGAPSAKAESKGGPGPNAGGGRGHQSLSPRGNGGDRRPSSENPSRARVALDLRVGPQGRAPPGSPTPLPRKPEPRGRPRTWMPQRDLLTWTNTPRRPSGPGFARGPAGPVAAGVADPAPSQARGGWATPSLVALGHVHDDVEVWLVRHGQVHVDDEVIVMA